MNWVKKHELLAIKTIQYDGQPYVELNNLGQVLHQLFNLAQNCHINPNLLDEIPTKHTMTWNPFLAEEFRSAITKCNNSSTSEPDKLSWKYLKAIVKDDIYLNNFVNIANMYINLEYWLLYFKMSLSIIIFKPNKASYDSPKMFQPIVLLNILGKLIEKVISKRL